MRKYVLLFSVCLFLSSCSGPQGSNQPKSDNTGNAAAAAPNPPATAPTAPAPVAVPQPAAAPVRPEPKRAATKAPAPVAPPAPVAANPAPVPEPASAQPAIVDAPAPPPPPPAVPPVRVVDTRNITIPAGTEISVRLIDSIDSKTAHENETYRASIDAPIIIDKETALAKGADVDLKVIHVATAGQVKGQSDLQVVLDRIHVGRNSYPVQTNVYETSGSSQGQKAARNGAVGAAIGAAIGAITGGGKGAVIGAGAGAGGGVGTAVLTKDQVRIESETRLVFTLTDPIDVAALPPGASSRDSSTGPARLEPPDDPAPGNRNRNGRFPGGRRNRP